MTLPTSLARRSTKALSLATSSLRARTSYIREDSGYGSGKRIEGSGPARVLTRPVATCPGGGGPTRGGPALFLGFCGRGTAQLDGPAPGPRSWWGGAVRHRSAAARRPRARRPEPERKVD